MGTYVVTADPVLGSICLLLRRGMDVYNKHFCNSHKKDDDIFHDEFYTKDDIVDAYSRYVATIVKRYAQEASVLGTPLSIVLLRWSYSPHLEVGNLPTTHAVPPVFLRLRAAHLRPLLNGLRPLQQS